MTRMFATLSASLRRDLFLREPEHVGPDSPRELMAHQLGGTLYVRGTQLGLARAISREGARGTTSVVVCMEDAIGLHELDAAEANFEAALATLQRGDTGHLPMIFARVRRAGHLSMVSRRDSGGLIEGFVLPKFRPEDAESWFAALSDAASLRGRRLWVMPVLESVELADPAARGGWLESVKSALAPESDTVLALRVGATDIAGSLSLRRPAGFTLYDIAPLRDALGAIVGAFASEDSVVPAISGSAYEHFTPDSRVPDLGLVGGGDRSARHDATEHARVAGFQAMAAELALDRAHGLAGKTAIHPSQVPLINSWQPVTHEDYVDAQAVLATHGATISDYANKMNEAQPHRLWALKTLVRSRAAGVLAASVSWRDVFEATRERGPRASGSSASRTAGLVR